MWWRDAVKHKNPLIILLSKSNRVDVLILRGCAKWTTVVLITLSTSDGDIDAFLQSVSFWVLKYRKTDKSSRQYYPPKFVLYTQHISHERRQNINKRSIVNLSKTRTFYEGDYWLYNIFSSCWEMIYIFLPIFSKHYLHLIFAIPTYCYSAILISFFLYLLAQTRGLEQ